MAYLLFFLSGLFGVNGIPHFVKGITGEPHMTPFGKPSGPVVNVLWGLVNFVIATLFFYGGYYHGTYNHTAAVILGFIGALCTSLSLALLWHNDDKAKGKISR